MDAGQIIVKINGDTSGLNKSLTDMKTQLANAGKSTESMAASVFKGVAAWDVMKKVLGETVKFLGDCVKGAMESEQVNKRLAIAVGVNAKAFQSLATELAKTTKYTDEQIAQSMTLAKSYGVANSSLAQVTKNAISLSSAFGLDLSAATKAATLAMQGNTEALTRIIPELRTTKDASEQLRIVNEAMARGWTLATEEINSSSGQIQMLSKNFDEMKEAIGTALLPVLGDTASAFNDIVVGVTDWMTIPTSQKLKEEQAQVNALAAVLMDTTKAEWERAAALDKLKQINPDVVKGVNLERDGTKQLAENLKKVNDEYLKSIILQEKREELEKAAKDVAVIRNKMFSLEQDIRRQAIKSLQGYYTQEELLKMSTKDMIGVLEKQNATYMDADSDVTAFTGTTDKLIKKYAAIESQQTALIAKSEAYNNILLEQQALVDILGGAVPSTGGTTTTNKTSSTTTMDVDTSKYMEKMQTLKDMTIQIIQSIGTIASEVFSGVGKYMTDSLSQATDALQISYDKQVEELDNSLAKEVELLTYHGQTKEQFQTDELAKLQAQLATTRDAKQQEVIQDQINSILIEKANDKHKKKELQMEKHLKKEKWKLEVAAFNAKKALDISSVWIQAGIGIAAAWAGAAGWAGPAVIAGMVIAGVLTGLITTMAGIQTGFIAAQQPPAPAFAQGGIVSSPQMVLAGERGPEAILPAELTNLLMNTARGGSSQNINLVLDGEVLARWFVNTQQREALLY